MHLVKHPALSHARRHPHQDHKGERRETPVSLQPCAPHTLALHPPRHLFLRPDTPSPTARHLFQQHLPVPSTASLSVSHLPPPPGGPIPTLQVPALPAASSPGALLAPIYLGTRERGRAGRGMGRKLGDLGVVGQTLHPSSDQPHQPRSLLADPSPPCLIPRHRRGRLT